MHEFDRERTKKRHLESVGVVSTSSRRHIYVKLPNAYGGRHMVP